MGTDHRGDVSDDVTEDVYAHLRVLAGGYFKRQPDNHTLQPTALVHEAFIKLAHQDASRYRDREHFFAVAATAMRQVLVSHARKRRAKKRGGSEQHRVTLSNVALPDSDAVVDMLELEQALAQLEQLNERHARIVEYRFFGGLTLPEIAKVLDVSHSTIEKDWRRARAWLASQLR